MTPDQALGFLRGPTTVEFLQAYQIKIAGRPGPPSQVVTYYISSDVTSGTEIFQITHDEHIYPGNFEFDAHSIYMVPGNAPYNVVALDGYVLDQNGPDLMVTGMLNGCSFLMKANAARTQVRCAHLRPAPGEGGARLNVRMVNNAGFHGDPGPLLVYGRANYPDTQGGRSSTVIGVRKAGVWGIYQQQFDANGAVLAASRIL
ncbi:hypothetical protein [Novosphingobium resinovorum]|uniref:hypothetical protein n=1 Tax=Novosphingobium resinovorum TaxID=158500 RepID=UPI002ED315BC|nr:hypothetical protein [Novosphingobium resinovorum]